MADESVEEYEGCRWSKTVGVRVPAEVFPTLERMARQRRMKTGVFYRELVLTALDLEMKKIARREARAREREQAQATPGIAAE